MLIKTVQTSKGAVTAVHAPNARQTFVPLPVIKTAPGRTNTYPANVAAVIAPNARQSR